MYLRTYRHLSDYEVTHGPMTRPATLSSSATSSSNSTDFSSSSSSRHLSHTVLSCIVSNVFRVVARVFSDAACSVRVRTVRRGRSGDVAVAWRRVHVAQLPRLLRTQHQLCPVHLHRRPRPARSTHIHRIRHAALRHQQVRTTGDPSPRLRKHCEFFFTDNIQHTLPRTC